MIVSTPLDLLFSMFFQLSISTREGGFYQMYFAELLSDLNYLMEAISKTEQ